MAEITTKSFAQKPKKDSDFKLCKKCKEQKEVTDFAPNREWIEEKRRDIWCRECVKKLTTKTDIKQYFWYNNRAWVESIWDSATRKAEKALAGNVAYKRSAPDVQAKLLERITCQQVQSSMSSAYKFEPHYDKNGAQITFEDAREKGLIKDDVEEELIYSKEFNGKFTREDLEYLETYYARLEEDFNFDNESLRDYARKVCKASLASDKAQADFAAGKISYSDVKDAMNIFDMLSKSANFAACRRKTGEASGLTCWAETTMKLETSGIPIETKVEFPPDDIDKTIEELRHIVKALGLDSV